MVSCKYHVLDCYGKMQPDSTCRRIFNMDGQMNGYIDINHHINKLDIKAVFAEVCKKMNLELSDVMGRSTKRDLADCRKIATKICIDVINLGKSESDTLYGYSAIGKVLGRKHSSIILMYSIANNYLQNDREFQIKYAMCEDVVKEHIDTMYALKRDVFHVES